MSPARATTKAVKPHAKNFRIDIESPSTTDRNQICLPDNQPAHPELLTILVRRLIPLQITSQRERCRMASFSTAWALEGAAGKAKEI